MGNTCLKDAATNPWISMKCIIIAKSRNINVSEVDGKRREREKKPRCCSFWRRFRKQNVGEEV